jgi:hypothetical protein
MAISLLEKHCPSISGATALPYTKAGRKPSEIYSRFLSGNGALDTDHGYH